MTAGDDPIRISPRDRLNIGSDPGFGYTVRGATWEEILRAAEEDRDDA